MTRLIIPPDRQTAYCGHCQHALPLALAGLWGKAPSQVSCPFCRHQWQECFVQGLVPPGPARQARRPAPASSATVKARAYGRAYYHRHKAQRQAYQRAYYRKHRERLRLRQQQYAATYYRKRKGHILAARRLRAAQAQQAKEKAGRPLTWLQRHRDAYLAYCRDYNTRHKDRMYAQNRKADEAMKARERRRKHARITTEEEQTP